MSKLVNGHWLGEGHLAGSGSLVREPTPIQGRVTADGSSGFRAESGRYHLYVSLACPWSHRALLMRRLKGLEYAISLSIVHPHLGDDGWEFREGQGTIPDPIQGARFLRDLYLKAHPDYTGPVTVPVLWDKQTETIVCIESRSLLRDLSREFGGYARQNVDYCPPDLTAEIDREIDLLYAPVNKGVYRTGLATTQAAYDQAVGELFDALDRYEARLRTQRFLLGSRLTEADICFFTTLVRFDLVYHYLFNCNLRKIADCPELSRYLDELYTLPGVAELCDFSHIKEHYYTSYPRIHPTRIIPRGPSVAFSRLP